MSVKADIADTDNVFLGEDKLLQFNVVDSGGSAQTMTGWALEFVVRISDDHPDTVLSKTTGGGAIAISSGAGTNDRATVTITDTDTVSLAPRTYRYALRRTDAGFEQVLAWGNFVLKQATTR